MPPRVSVVTTVYNGQHYFDRALPSILEQTYTDFEYVIVDDGSEDRTPELLQQAAARDPRVRVLSPGRLGFSAALNYGIARAAGTYIARQDFDDSSCPDRLRLQVEFLDRHPDVALVGGWYFLIDDLRGERYLRKPPSNHRQIVRGLAKYIPFAHTIVMFRKRAWAEEGGYPEVDDLEDIRLWIAFARRGWKLANLQEPLGTHWVHGGSFWFRNWDYASRQRQLGRVQWQAVRQLHLPFRMAVFPAGRLFYSLFPTGLKRVVRRRILKLEEQDVQPWQT